MTEKSIPDFNPLVLSSKGNKTFSVVNGGIEG
jgi:hypothetical protein